MKHRRHRRRRSAAAAAAVSAAAGANHVSLPSGAAVSPVSRLTQPEQRLHAPPPCGKPSSHGVKQTHPLPLSRRKSITFDPNRNSVRLVRVPPRSQNRDFWFTESPRVVKKGFCFELEPHISVELSVDCRIQLTALTQRPAVLSTDAAKKYDASAATPSGKDGGNTSHESGSRNGKKQRKGMTAQSSPESQRAFVEVREEVSLLGSPGADRWLCIGSTLPTVMEKVRAILPPGVYQIRVSGDRPVQVYAQAWEIERRLS